MAPRTYLNFDLLFEPEGQGLFRARVVDSPDGSRPFVDFALPFDPLTLENLLLKLDPGRSGTRLGAASQQVGVGQQLGGALFDAVFRDDVALSWARAKDLARGQDQGVRLRLHLADAPAIAGLPWELLYDDRVNRFVAQSERTPLVRFLDVASTQAPLRVDGPLRILAVISAPTDLADLDVETEWAHVQEALRPRIGAGQVSVDRLPAPTLDALGRWLRTHEVNVLHFIGHGELDRRTGEGVLYLCDDYGRSRPVPASVLGPYVLDHDPLRLIVLNACRSASTDASDPYGGMAQGLMQQQAAAVVAMQFPITDRAAMAFTQEFYGAVADGLPVDQSVTAARKALWAGFGAEWATPTVFLHTADGHLFDGIASAARGPEVTRAAAVVDVARAALSTGPTHAHAGPLTRGRTVLLGAGAAAAALVAAAVWLDLPLGDPDPAPPSGAEPSASAPDRAANAAQDAATGDNADAGQAAAGTPAVQTGPVVTASRLTARVDAGDEEWKGVPSYSSDRRVGGPSEPTIWADWRLGWDDDYYYVFVEVQDRTFTSVHLDRPSELWKGDSVHFEFGATSVAVPPDELDGRDRHVLLGPTETGQVVVHYRAPSTFRLDFGPGPRSRDSSGVVVFDEGGYTVEARIPWSELIGSATPTKGARFVTNLNVSDAHDSGDLAGENRSIWSNNLKVGNNFGRTRPDWGVVELTG